MSCSSSSPAPVARRLEGKVVIITGGASGFGKATAKLFIRHGAKVIVADVQDELGQSLCKEFEGCDHHEEMSYFHCDVTSDSDVENVVDFAIAKYGKLDVMFNNAGVTCNVDRTILATDNEKFKRAFEVNSYGCFLGAKHAARVMIPAKRGVILFTASLATENAGESPYDYIMSKYAVLGLMKNLCVELGQHGIRVNSISPTAVATPFLSNALGMDKKTLEGVLHDSANLKGAMAEADDVAEGALYLSSGAAKYVSGVNLVIDGGYSSTNLAFTKAIENFFSGKNAAP